VLFPNTIRDLVLPAFKAKKTTLEEIAKLVDLPLYYINLVMSDYWTRIHKMMVTRRPPDKVHTIDAAGQVLEVHSVGIGSSAYSYARWLIERNADSARPVSKCKIESGGKTIILTSQEILDISI
jgi:hypothetical protein